MGTTGFRWLKNGFLWLGWLVGLGVGIGFSVSHDTPRNEWDHCPHRSRYAQIGEKTSPDGSKRSIIFGEKDDGVDEMRHVKIVAKDQKFDPNSISPSRTKYPWEAIPAFEFSILRPLELKIAWTDNNNLDIVYPVDDDDTITFQRPKSVSSDVQIHPSAKEK